MTIRKTTKIRDIWLAFGENTHPADKHPTHTCGHARPAFEQACNELARHRLHIFARSVEYSTPPMGSVRQNSFHNTVIGVRGSIAPAALLRLLKRIERSAGRRLGVRWGPRPLDIDILDFGGRILGHPARLTRRGSLILPHPGIAARGFVLVPLSEAAPMWRHPILGVTARTLLKRRPGLGRGIVPRTTPSAPIHPCPTNK